MQLSLFTALVVLSYSPHHVEGWTAGLKRTKVGTSIAGIEIGTKSDFKCPEEFGFYPARDLTRYYVCVFGGALLESCTGGLVYSHELQTCDWPRNIGYPSETEAVTYNKPKPPFRPSADQKNNSPLTQYLSSDQTQSTTSSTNSRSKSQLTFELLGEVAVTIDNRQGRDFQGDTPLISQGQNAQIGGTSRNMLVGENPKQNRFNARSRVPRGEDLPDDFVRDPTR